MPSFPSCREAGLQNLRIYHHVTTSPAGQHPTAYAFFYATPGEHSRRITQGYKPGQPAPKSHTPISGGERQSAARESRPRAAGQVTGPESISRVGPGPRNKASRPGGLPGAPGWAAGLVFWCRAVWRWELWKLAGQHGSSGCLGFDRYLLLLFWHSAFVRIRVVAVIGSTSCPC